MEHHLVLLHRPLVEHSAGMYLGAMSMPLARASSSTLGNRPISNSKPRMSTLVMCFLRHSRMISSTKSRVTGRFTGPLPPAARRACRGRWQSPRSSPPGRRAGSGPGTPLPLPRVCCCFCSSRRSGLTPMKCWRSYLPRLRISKGAVVLAVGLELPLHADHAFAVVWMANLPRSVAIHLRPNFSATAAVVPEPQKKSAIRSPSLEEALMIRSRRASGF